MKKLTLAFVCVIVLALSSFTFAQDPNAVAPNIYKKIFENERVKVHSIQVKANEKIAAHSHPDHMAYALTECSLTITPDGGKPQAATVKEGEVIWFDAVTHSAQNTGANECRILVVELKEPKAK